MSEIRQADYRRLSGAQFSGVLRELGLSTDAFAWMTGANAKRVSKWRRGSEDIPPWVTLVCALLTLPETRDMAVKVTREFSTSPEPPMGAL